MEPSVSSPVDVDLHSMERQQKHVAHVVFGRERVTLGAKV